ncbi:hypothetical protein Taro_001216 [Colocasia esculenta]|uniref:Uncharacterized protein n=1 Tax=Colocasia esculenta TaxID=4460 RepID=A0A843TF87_COLES|nr:hypothetical protein [Colocasia esculenta]
MQQIGHMKVECPEAKKDKYKNHKKEFHKKKNKAMVATWSDEDQSSDSNKESSSSEGNEICFMVGSSEEQVYTNLSQWCRHSPPQLVVSTQSTCVSTLDDCPRKQSEQLKPVVSTQSGCVSTHFV